MTYLTADQWTVVLHKYRKACQRITIREGKLTRAQWSTLGRITDLVHDTMIDDYPRNRQGSTPEYSSGDYRPAWAQKLFPGNTPSDKPCPECLGEGIVFTGWRLTGRGLNSWIDAPEYEYVTCDVCGGTGLDCSDNDEVEE